MRETLSYTRPATQGHQQPSYRQKATTTEDNFPIRMPNSVVDTIICQEQTAYGKVCTKCGDRNQTTNACKMKKADYRKVHIQCVQ